MLASENIRYCYSDEFKTEFLKVDDKKTGYYPLGTILSIVWEWLKVQMNIQAGTPTNNVEEFLKRVVHSRYPKEDLNCYAVIENIYNHEKEIRATSLKNYLYYIESCLEHKDICNLSSLYQVSNMIDAPLKTGERTWYVESIGKFHDVLQPDTIHDILINYNKPNKKIGDARIIIETMNRTALNLYDAYNRSMAFNEDPQRVYDTTYRIESICDLISATLLQIFSLRKPIRKCLLCDKLFVPPKSDTKYCMYLDLPGRDRLCKDEAHSMQVNKQEYKRPLCDKIYRNIRKMLYEHYKYELSMSQAKQNIGEPSSFGEHGKRLNEFLAKNAEFRALLCKGKMPTIEYYQFLCSYYKSDKVREQRLKELFLS